MKENDNVPILDGKGKKNFTMDSSVKCKDCGFTMFDQRIIIRKVNVNDKETGKKGPQEHLFFPAYTCANCCAVLNLINTVSETNDKKE